VRGAVVARRISTAEQAAATRLHAHTTPLPDALWRCNTFSQNLFAECLIKSLAAYEADGSRAGVPGSWEGGRQVLRRTLADLGVDLRGAEIRDGCGLSHDNRVTARQVVTLLRAMRKHDDFAIFHRSLAEPGQPGSMRRRYDVPELRGRLHGKTGTIRHVRTLAGYLERPDGTTLAFAILINGAESADTPRDLCRALLAN
jgi:D-alanyl-D-alanine carboxypeptidase/D-alanyl-D-alanine-endopeptidase (penicillin-binding protein 4)